MIKEKPSLLTRIVERKPPLYWWTLLNISMACIAVMSWLYFVPTFSYPEEPKHYERLVMLGRAPELPHFTSSDVPDGTTLDALKAHTTFTSSQISNGDLEELNATLLRNYIQGIKHKKINYYLKGKFKVLQSRVLTKEDMFRDGIVVKAQSQRQVEGSDSLVPFLVEIEYLLPHAPSATLGSFKKGQLFDLFKAPHFCSLLHVKRLTGNGGETIIKLTLVPLTTAQPHPCPQKGKTIQLKAPERIYPDKELPILK